MWYNNYYLKVNIIGFPPLNKFAYHFINLGITFACRLFHRFVISSWWLSSHRSYLGYSASFLFCMSHWVKFSLWINFSPWSSVIFVASELTIIKSTIVLSQFEKLIRDERESVELVIKFLYGGVFLCSCLIWISRGEGLKNLQWHIGHSTLWTRHNLSVTST